jgi:hypothetical protein
MTLWRQIFLYPLHMYFGILAAGAVAQIGAELKHGKAVFLHFFAKVGIVLFVLLGFGGQIKKHHNPHNSIRI